MTKKTSLTIITAGLLAAAVLCTPYTPSAAQGRAAATSDFSAQAQQDNKGQSKKAAPAARPAPQRAAPQRAAPRVAAPQRAPRTVTRTSSDIAGSQATESYVACGQAAESHITRNQTTKGYVARS